MATRPAARTRASTRLEKADLLDIYRLIYLSRRLDDKDEFGFRWTIMADVEGNEFCLAQEPAQE